MIQVAPLNERLRELRGAKMVVDVVRCNSGAVPGLKKALQFVCGNAVVCETLRDARSVAFDGPQRIKVRPRRGFMDDYWIGLFFCSPARSEEDCFAFKGVLMLDLLFFKGCHFIQRDYEF